MAVTFNDFVQTELPKRPFTDTDGSPGQVLVRSNRPEAPREMVWVDLPGVEAPSLAVAGPGGVSGHRAVMVNPDGSVSHADPAVPWSFIGISKNAAAEGSPVQIATRDTVTEMSWDWTPGETIYLTSGGVLTQTPPVFGSVTPVAVALSPNTLLIARHTPVILGD